MSVRERKRQSTGDDMVIGANIQTRRIAAGLTLSGLATSLGISHQQLQKYEKGTNRTCASMIYRVSRSLNVPLVALFDGVEGIAELETMGSDLATARESCKGVVDSTLSLTKLDAMCRILTILGNEDGKHDAD